MRRSSRVLIFGLCFLVFGLGNWGVGTVKMDFYKSQRALAVQMGGAGVRERFRGTESILQTRGTAHELYAHARGKYRYYRVFHHGGRVLAIVGLVLVVGALTRRWIVPEPGY
jgi:hypothetical protein